VTCLAVPELVLLVVDVDGAQELLSSLFVVNELTLRDHAGVQYFVPSFKRDDIIYIYIYYLDRYCDYDYRES